MWRESIRCASIAGCVWCGICFSNCFLAVLTLEPCAPPAYLKRLDLAVLRMFIFVHLFESIFVHNLLRMVYNLKLWYCEYSLVVWVKEGDMGQTHTHAHTNLCHTNDKTQRSKYIISKYKPLQAAAELCKYSSEKQRKSDSIDQVFSNASWIICRKSTDGTTP